MKRVDIIIDRTNKDIFSFFEMKAIQEILTELSAIKIIEMIKKVL